MHALGETGGDDEAGSVRALRAERVGFVDDQRRTVALADLDQLGERRHVAVGAVERVDRDEARSVLAQHPVERWRVVVAEEDGASRRR